MPALGEGKECLQTAKFWDHPALQDNEEVLLYRM
jgi:hypothetical protein